MFRSLSFGIIGMTIGVGLLALIPEHVQPQPPGPIDVRPQALPRIPVGTVIGAQPPTGWTHLVLFATPTLTEAALREAPSMAGTAIFYAKMFKFTILANVDRVTSGAKTSYYLKTVARGFATTVNGKETIVSTQNTLGADLKLFGKKILDENENCIDTDLRQVVRTNNMMILDANAVMLRDGKHAKMIMRQAIMVDPQTGNLQSLIWLLEKNYQAAEKTIQALPPNFHEQRWLSIDRNQFRFGIPTREAFALRQIPDGPGCKKMSYSPELLQVATIGTFTAENVPNAERILLHVARWAATGK